MGGIYQRLAKKLADVNKAAELKKRAPIQETTFSVDLLGQYICSSWDEVHAANEPQAFDVVVIGAGMFGAYCAEKLFRRDIDKRLRTLVLDAGAFFLPTQKQNLPIGGINESVVWECPWEGDKAYVDGSGMAYCVGGRSLFWAGWAPELRPNDLKQWPEDVRKFLKSADGYAYTGAEIGSKKKTGFIVETDLYKQLYKNFQTAKKKVSGEVRVDLVQEAPLAVLGSPPTSGFFSFEKYSSVTFLIDAVNEDSSAKERHLMLLPRAEVTRLNRDKQAVTSLDLEVLGVPKNLRLGPDTKVVVANGTVEATRLALASLGVGRQDSGRLKVGNFMAHMMSSISVRIKRSALGLGDRPSKSENEMAAFIARGEAYGRRFHHQIVAAAREGAGGIPWTVMMQMMPDIDQLDHLMSGNDSRWISFVFRGVAEMEDDRRVDAAGTWKSWIGLKQNEDIAYATLNPSANDRKLWKAADSAAIMLAKALAGSPENIEYWWGSKDQRGGQKWGWQAEELDLDLADNLDLADIWWRDGIGKSQHEGGTLFMGKDKDKSITDTDGKFHHLSNVYVAGPALFPTLGSANPSLTGLTLARRTADAILLARGITPPKTPSQLIVATNGWPYFGAEVDGHWQERNFSQTQRPRPGDQIVATVDVNIRSGPIEFDGSKWVNKSILGAAHVGDEFSVKSVAEVSPGFFWVEVELTPSLVA
jgi:choline dehydrogenase-like flavoprotein